MKKLFQSVDASGDGTLNLEEFAKLVSSPKLRFWMGQLELEYHDLLSLFEFLDPDFSVSSGGKKNNNNVRGANPNEGFANFTSCLWQL